MRSQFRWIKRHRFQIASTAIVIFAIVIINTHNMRERHGSSLARPSKNSHSRPEVFHRVWSASINEFRAAGISADGKYVSILTGYSTALSTEHISLWHWSLKPNKPVWTRTEPDASETKVSNNGRIVICSSTLNPINTSVVVRKGMDGSLMSKQQLDGPIWDLAISDDGLHAGITTGNRSLYEIALGDGSYVAPQFHRLTMDGIGNSVDLTSQNNYLSVGLWDNTGVSCFTMPGGDAPIWRYPNDKTDEDDLDILKQRLLEAHLSENGKYVLGLSFANARRSDGTLHLWRTDSDGTPLWSYSLGVNTFSPSALISQDGLTIAVSYIRQIPSRTRMIIERNLLVMDNRSHVLWDHGNLLFSPNLIGMAPDGHRITVSDGVHTLYSLNQNGRITQVFPVTNTGTIERIWSTPDGDYFLIYTSDGMLSLIKIG